MSSPHYRIPTALAFAIVIFLTLLPVAARLLGVAPGRAVPHDLSNPATAEGPTLETASAPPDPFLALSLKARAAIVWDVNTGQTLFSRNEEEQLPLASLTKIAGALAALERSPSDTPITITRAALAREGDAGLFLGERWRLADLLDFALLTSSNDAMYAAASGGVGEGDSDSIALMNRLARDAGLTQTFFANETGLDLNGEVSGGYGSARDVARLMAHALAHAPHALEATRYSSLSLDSLDNLSHNAKNTNEFAARIPGIIASKTGYTTLAGGNLVVAFDAGIAKPIVVVVLGSTIDGRFSDVDRLIEATLDFLSQK